MSFVEENPHTKWSKAWLEIEAEKAKLQSRMASLVECDALIDAGWKFEFPEIVNNWKIGETEPWQWYWRSPPKRKGSKGRRYHSTSQAYNALQRMK